MTQAEFTNLQRGFCSGAVGDVTGDGLADIFLVRYAGAPTDMLWANNGAGTFIDVSANLGDLAINNFSTAATVVDMNGDGVNDLVKISTTNQDGEPPVTPPAALGDHGVFVLFNDGTGNFNEVVHAPDSNPGGIDNNPNAAYHFTVGDLTGNGLADIYAVNDAQDWLALAKGVNADGTVQYADRQLYSILSPRTANPGGVVKMADIDGDGRLDVGVSPINNRLFDQDPTCANEDIDEFALLRNGGGFLYDPFFYARKNIHLKPWDFSFADFNGDGRTDIFMALCEGGYKVFWQTHY